MTARETVGSRYAHCWISYLVLHAAHKLTRAIFYIGSYPIRYAKDSCPYLDATVNQG